MNTHIMSYKCFKIKQYCTGFAQNCYPNATITLIAFKFKVLIQ